MTAQEDFESWYLKEVGFRLIKEAFMAGREAGRMAKDKRIPPSVREFWSEAIKEEKKLRERVEE